MPTQTQTDPITLDITVAVSVQQPTTTLEEKSRPLFEQEPAAPFIPFGYWSLGLN